MRQVFPEFDINSCGIVVADIVENSIFDMMDAKADGATVTTGLSEGSAVFLYVFAERNLL